MSRNRSHHQEHVAEHRCTSEFHHGVDRSVTKWNKACGQKLARLILFIWSTKDSRQYCFVSCQVQDCHLNLQDASFARDLQDAKNQRLVARLLFSDANYLDGPQTNVSFTQQHRSRD